jgi:hypothetical protein
MYRSFCEELKRAEPQLDLASLAVRRREPSEEARAIVARMAGLGLKVREIGRLTGYLPAALYRSFRHELTTARLKMDLDVLERAYWQAVGGPERDWKRADPGMTRLWLGQRQGWKAPPAHDRGKRVEIDLDRLSDDELTQLDQLLSQAGDEEAGSPAGE